MKAAGGRPSLFFSVEQLPDGSYDKKHAEGFFQKSHIQPGSQEIAQKGAQESGEDRRDGQAPVGSGLLPAKQGRNEGAGEEEHQVHHPRRLRVCPQHQGHPQQQQAALLQRDGGRPAGEA